MLVFKNYVCNFYFSSVVYIIFHEVLPNHNILTCLKGEGESVYSIH